MTQTHTNANSNKPSDDTKIKILQLNINGIQNKIAELTQLTHESSPDIITIQESKLSTASNKINIPGYITIRKDRQNKVGGGLITYIREEIPFTEFDTTQYTNKITSNQYEIQITSINLSTTKRFHITNLYIPPRDCNTITTNEDQELDHLFTKLFSLTNNIITGDLNAHSSLWHSSLTDHRGKIISGIIQNSDYTCLNTNTSTRIPFDRTQNKTSPDVTIIPSELLQHSTWNTSYSLSSDHLPITTTINTKIKFKLVQYRNCYTNYHKANWAKFTQKLKIRFQNRLIQQMCM